MSIELIYTEDTIQVTGKTYPHREFLKSLGARFAPDTKFWILQKTEENQLALARFTEKPLKSLPIPQKPPVLQDSIEKSDISVSISVEQESEKQQDSPPLNQDMGIGVGALMSRIEQILTGSFKAPIWVTGELQNLTFRKGALFFQLCEGDGQSPQAMTVSCNIWSHQLALLKKRHGEKEFSDFFQEGFQVRLLCMVQFYKGRGQVSLNIIDCDPQYTKGLQALQREALIKELKSAGLFDANKKLAFPSLPFRIGLITAPDSRAFGDFTHQLSSLLFPGEVIFFPSSMQGTNTLTEVAQGIKTLQSLCDVIVLTRGGGSQGDLAWFDGKEIAYAIAQSTVPIVSAIGHHDDQSIAQDLSYLHCKTPTAAADFIAEHFSRIKEKLRAFQDQFTEKLLKKILLEEQKISQIRQSWSRLVHLSLEKWTRFLDQKALKFSDLSLQILTKKHHHLDRIQDQLPVLSFQKIEHFSQILHNLEKSLSARDPRPWLQKGWTQLMTQDGEPVLRVSQTTDQQLLWARLTDGKIHLKIQKNLKKR